MKSAYHKWYNVALQRRAERAALERRATALLKAAVRLPYATTDRRHTKPSAPPSPPPGTGVPHRYTLSDLPQRGYQQGAHAVLQPLSKAGLVDTRITAQVADFVYHKIYWWRYAKRRRLERHLNKDTAPRLTLKG